MSSKWACCTWCQIIYNIHSSKSEVQFSSTLLKDLALVYDPFHVMFLYCGILYRPLKFLYLLEFSIRSCSLTLGCSSTLRCSCTSSTARWSFATRGSHVTRSFWVARNFSRSTEWVSALAVLIHHGHYQMRYLRLPCPITLDLLSLSLKTYAQHNNFL